LVNALKAASREIISRAATRFSLELSVHNLAIKTFLAFRSNVQFKSEISGAFPCKRTGNPELNPDELLNHDVKTNALDRVRPVNVQKMMDNVRSYLRITQARPTVVKNYFCEPHVRYAAS
jgi:hypothetical protein